MKNYNTRLAKAAFEGYKRSMKGITFDGREIPEWENLGDNVQEAWFGAAASVINESKIEHS